MLFLLVACQQTPMPVAEPDSVGYLLAGQNAGQNFSRNALLIFDAATLDPLATHDLPASRARYVQLDPAGNVWIGLSGTFDRADDRVLVIAPDGTRLHTLRLCQDPEGGITFAGERAFVACAEDGFAARVVALDTDTLEVAGEVALQRDDGAPFVVLGSAATADALIVTGLTTGPLGDQAYTALAVIDPAALAMDAQIVLDGADVWSVLPHAGRFLLLNAASDQAAPDGPRRDVLLLDPAAPNDLDHFTLPHPAPVWGALDGDVLYAYHNPAWNSTATDAKRHVSRFDLATGEAISWPLPDNFEAGGLAVYQGRPCLAHWDYWQDDAVHGLYCLDADGNLSQRLALPDASDVVLP